MANGAYIGVNGVAKKVKGGYIGVGGVAKKITKAYIGVGGVARPCWGGGELTYYGTATALSAARSGLVATHVGDYALFGGGYSGSYDSTVDAYNTSLVKSFTKALSDGKNRLAATHIGDYALFGGGYKDDNSSVVNAYNTSLVRSTPTALSVARSGLVATHIGDYALFGGGYKYIDSNTYINTVDAYNTSLVRSTPTELSVARYNLAATHIGDYALFGGGSDSSGNYSIKFKTTVDAYNTSLVRSLATALSDARSGLAATHIGDYALFGGGIYGNRGFRKIIDVYTVA